MKAIILSIVLFMSSVSIFASTEKTVKMTNVAGNVKECTVVDKQTGQPIKKTVYENNEAGFPITKVLYKWDAKQGWVSQCRNNFTYDEGNTVINVSYQLWDAKKQVWVDKE